ncbi:MAG TPA: hypothetical protein VN856_19840 [Mycobacterium sp.]|uniref:hypothetical protein n=1 Tax=Mycobacterium sp. TaxID=1785 RepID=UPI002C14AD2F|nr:hypothetical protein [Mycobacterium sp.]HXO82129.1 hypothetical protein [Mycobacterium sp.]
MAGEAGRHLRGLDAAPHYHVIAENQAGELICSDGFAWPTAQGFAADLISPPPGAPVYEPVQTVWIVQGEPLRCPLAHGDNTPDDEQAAAGFLERVLQQPPFWSA